MDQDAINRAMLALLKRLEWQQADYGAGNPVAHCVLCYRTKTDGHDPKCELAILIMELEINKGI